MVRPPGTGLDTLDRGGKLVAQARLGVRARAELVQAEKRRADHGGRRGRPDGDGRAYLEQAGLDSREDGPVRGPGRGGGGGPPGGRGGGAAPAPAAAESSSGGSPRRASAALSGRSAP